MRACSARHMSKHIPGNPPIVVQNMPGAGSLRGTNFIYNVAPRDGTTFGTFARNMALLGLIKTNQNVQFDPTKVHLARLVVELRRGMPMCCSCARTPRVEVDRGGAPSGRAADHPRLDGRGRVERRHRDPAARVARLQHEGHSRLHRLGRAVPRDRAERDRGPHRRTLRGALEPARLAQAGRAGARAGRVRAWAEHADFPDAPTARELARNAEDRHLIEVIEIPYALSRPFAAPPDVPPDRAKALQDALPRDPQGSRLLWRRPRSSASRSARSAAEEVLRMIDRIAEDAGGPAQADREADHRGRVSSIAWPDQRSRQHWPASVRGASDAMGQHRP